MKQNKEPQQFADIKDSMETIIKDNLIIDTNERDGEYILPMSAMMVYCDLVRLIGVDLSKVLSSDAKVFTDNLYSKYTLVDNEVVPFSEIKAGKSTGDELVEIYNDIVELDASRTF